MIEAVAVDLSSCFADEFGICEPRQDEGLAEIIYSDDVCLESL